MPMTFDAAGRPPAGAFSPPDEDELSDAELNNVVGGLSRVWIAPDEALQALGRMPMEEGLRGQL
ncbi:MAG TPA: hypothetical protein VF584_20470 [Longimicrobium sp.]|jgi:bacteriocin-like protein